MQLRTIVIGLAVSLAATACASSADEAAEVSGTEADSRSIGQAAVDAINETSDGACSINLRTIQTALEAYFAINGTDASTLADLDDLLADDLSDTWVLEPAADDANTAPQVVPVPGGACDI